MFRSGYKSNRTNVTTSSSQLLRFSSLLQQPLQRGLHEQQTNLTATTFWFTSNKHYTEWWRAAQESGQINPPLTSDDNVINAFIGRINDFANDQVTGESLIKIEWP
jgi:hypothetical protein